MAKIKKRKKKEVDPVEKRFEKLERDFGKLKEKVEDLNDQVKLLESPNESPKTFMIPSGKVDPKLIEDFLKASKSGMSLGAKAIQNQKPKPPAPPKCEVIYFTSICTKCKHVIKENYSDLYSNGNECRAKVKSKTMDYSTGRVTTIFEHCTTANPSGKCKEFEPKERMMFIKKSINFIKKKLINFIENYTAFFAISVLVIMVITTLLCEHFFGNHKLW